MKIRILHTNDLHGKLTQELAIKIASLRQEGDFYFDSGDCIAAGNLAIPLKPEKAWSLLNLAHCDAGTIGNRETHINKLAFAKKIEGVSHPIVCCNLIDAKTKELVFPASIVLEKAGFRAGIIGVSVPMVTERMITKNASAYLWTPPIPALTTEVERLKPTVDAVFVLSHLGHQTDVQLASIPGIDVIFGGHSHTVIESPEQVGNTWIVQGGSHARFLGEYEFDTETKKLTGWLTLLKTI